MKSQRTPYIEFSAEDFALDNKFQQWVLDPDEEAARFWNEFMLTFPDKQSEISEAKELVLLAGLSSDPEANAAYLNTWKYLKENAEGAAAVQDRPVRNQRYALLAAAIAGILLVASYFLWSPLNKPAFEEFQTAFGEVREIVLKDGSKVTLNSNSHLRYLSDFTADREVSLEGEAFFEVTESKDQKFVVQTQSNLDVEVLGTEFNVNTRRKNIEIYLQSGKVKVNAASGKMELKPGEKLSYSKESRTLNVSKETTQTAENVLGWMNKVYIYNDDSLNTIAEEIEDHYGLDVVITDPTLEVRKFTGTIPSQRLEVVLEVLSETLEITIEKQDNQIIIRPLDD